MRWTWGLVGAVTDELGGVINMGSGGSIVRMTSVEFGGRGG